MYLISGFVRSVTGFADGFAEPNDAEDATACGDEFALVVRFGTGMENVMQGVILGKRRNHVALAGAFGVTVGSDDDAQSGSSVTVSR